MQIAAEVKQKKKREREKETETQVKYWKKEEMNMMEERCTDSFQIP